MKWSIRCSLPWHRLEMCGPPRPVLVVVVITLVTFTYRNEAWLNRSLDIHYEDHSYIASLLTPLEDAIHLQLIPALIGYDSCSSNLKDLLALPCRLGGMGIINPTDIADSQFDASVKVTSCLKSLIVHQSLTASPPASKLIFITTVIPLIKLRLKMFMLPYPSLFRGPWTSIVRKAPHLG